jgi:NAD(P)-dependent dehydrogenase (short-subunit alcohol dehydrogenase family)
MLTDSSWLQVNGETVKLGIPGAAQRMEASAKLMIPLQRVGTPEDAAGAMLMLASPYSSYITAQVLLRAINMLCCSADVCVPRLWVALESNCTRSSSTPCPVSNLKNWL